MPKLFIILATDAPIAVIIRRGPSRWHHIIEWDTRRDRFTHGAWIKGRIYEDKCDVSPDGRLFLYFVHKGGLSGTEFTDAWTAVSRTPWLQALTLWPQGTTYNGGGRFIDNRTIALRAVLYPPHKDFPLQGLRVTNNETPLHVKTDDVTDADWCGRDHKDRIIFTRGGQLFRRENSTDRLIADFTDLTPHPEAAPEWARRPL
jgi:hypothetical protein